MTYLQLAVGKFGFGLLAIPKVNQIQGEKNRKTPGDKVIQISAELKTFFLILNFYSGVSVALRKKLKSRDLDFLHCRKKAMP